MLQLIGYLGCLYLFVKGLSILSNESYKGLGATVAALIAIAGSVIFAMLFTEQGSQVADAVKPLTY